MLWYGVSGDITIILDRDLFCSSTTSLGFPTVKINLKSMVNCTANTHWDVLVSFAQQGTLLFSPSQLHHFSSSSHLVRVSIFVVWALGAVWSCLQACVGFWFGPFQSFQFYLQFSALFHIPCRLGFTESVSCVRQENTSRCSVGVF